MQTILRKQFGQKLPGLRVEVLEKLSGYYDRLQQPKASKTDAASHRCPPDRSLRMQTVSETFAGTITVHRQMRLALPRMAMSLLIMSYLVADGVLISRFVGTTALSALSMSYPLTALLIAAGFMIAAGGGR